MMASLTTMVHVMFNWLRTSPSKESQETEGTEVDESADTILDEYPTFSQASAHFKKVSSTTSLKIPYDLIAEIDGETE